MLHRNLWLLWISAGGTTTSPTPPRRTSSSTRACWQPSSSRFATAAQVPREHLDSARDPHVSVVFADLKGDPHYRWSQSLPLMQGYPYMNGVRRLMEFDSQPASGLRSRTQKHVLRLHKKKAWDMATPEFQRLVRMDPENVARLRMIPCPAWRMVFHGHLVKLHAD